VAAAYRIYLGGAGMVVGLAVIAESAALGSAAFYLRRHASTPVLPRHVLELGLLVHVVMLGLISTLPGGLAAPSMPMVAAVTLTVFPLATAAVCWFLLEGEGLVAARRALAQSEEQLKSAIEASGTGLWDMRLGTGDVVANEQWAGMLGYRLSELEPITFATWTGLVHPDDLGDVMRSIAEHEAGETPSFDVEVRVRHKDGHWVWVVSKGQVVERSRAGEPVRMTGTQFDVTGLKVAEIALQESHEKMEQMVLDVAEAMGRIVEARDPYTQGHEQRVSKLASSIAERMGMDADEADSIEMAGLLHDVGKLHVPAEILTKPGKLSEVEFALIREHPLRGYEILKDIAFPWPISTYVLQHHERLDGSGYPSGLKGDDILMPSRILAVADVVEAMASHRPYRASLGMEAAIAEVRCNPEKYDSGVVAALLELHEAGEIRLSADHPSARAG
jgi:PAS domain S-box-containing protein/putative nucleotidyltransferase with HDIG domain